MYVLKIHDAGWRKSQDQHYKILKTILKYINEVKINITKVILASYPRSCRMLPWKGLEVLRLGAHPTEPAGMWSECITQPL